MVTLKIARPVDHSALRRIFHDLSSESRRFFGIAEPSDALVAQWCDASEPAQALTLMAVRAIEGEVVGPMSLARSTFRTVVAETAIPSPFSSPTRRW
jgi:hypothetical protein